MSKKVLMVVTNHTEIDAENKTGLWLEEFAVPYNIFKEKGYEIKVTSIKGGKVELDPNSIPEESHPEWEEAQQKLEITTPLSKEDANQFDAVFLPGGHGTMFDFPDSETLLHVLQEQAQSDKVIGAVCHGPAGLVNVTYNDGTPIVQGKQVTGFTDSEEEEMQLVEKMPFLLESTLRLKGADFTSQENWADFAVRDGKLVTGQNPQSSASAANKVVEALEV
ncbi:type 1 glutamine amidotransferase domain-containing protein [Guptibacillus algicola]|uniref:type 1 glutamine amidotransferase domain-containing protein n=1 Tax=Guptibacillus algicola TaxID=225844 RepID=UPI001CD357B7|nr:type 1 glutamine amidotransferase domain-containing protein [Alkalihalobacillus algicola]MCA0987631.1 type 1 glutamine amidotransferase domain-containing protein [Alkalihalobacillus algicola]